MDRLHSIELTIFLVLFPKVNTIGAIFMIVPLMIVVAIPVVVPSVVILSRHCNGYK